MSDAIDKPTVVYAASDQTIQDITRDVQTCFTDEDLTYIDENDDEQETPTYTFETLGARETAREQETHKEMRVFPRNWKPMESDENLKMVVLDLLCPEYETVAHNFHASLYYNQLHKYDITQIELIQNKGLYKQFMVTKDHMDELNYNGGENERTLYHGTSKDTITKISGGGFNRSFAGKNATALGEGCYFAVNPSYSANFSTPDINGNKYMYQVRVLTGEYTKGEAGLRTPPPKISNDSTDCYDSVVDDVDDPSIFVVFNDAMAYPEYLITFRVNP
ncbi:protein mono-ADP-ribosyltransferase PARP15-like [Glandiceps talaboti]